MTGVTTEVLMSHRWRFLAELLSSDSTPKIGYNSQQILHVLYSLHPPLKLGNALKQNSESLLLMHFISLKSSDV